MQKPGLTADSQWDLALWCEDHGLNAEAKAHLAAVVRLEPSREAAWKRLGCKKHHGRWMTQEQIDTAIAEEKAQDRADKTWGPKLARLKDDLKVAARRADAEREIAKIDAPRAVPTVWRLFAHGSAADQARAVQIFAQTDAVAASQALAMLAVFGQTDGVRRAATESLVWRDRREFLDGLIGLLRVPLKYQVRPAMGPGDSPSLLVEGDRYNVARKYETPSPPPSWDFLVINRAMWQNYVNRCLWNGPISRTDRTKIANALIQGQANPVQALTNLAQSTNSPALETSPKVDGVPLDSFISAGIPLPFGGQISGMWEGIAGGYSQTAWLPNMNRNQQRQMEVAIHDIQEYRYAIMAQEQRLERDVAYLGAVNQLAEASNQRVSEVLETLTSQRFGSDRDQWASWWTDAKGYAYQPPSTAKPTFVEAAPLDYQPFYIAMAHGACFAKGTLVQTLEGPKRIETIEIGDRVLTQDVKTGELSYEPVLTPVHNPPNETFRVDLGTETIVATGIHRFWKAGEGWAMVRDLKPGDRVRTVGGIATIQGISGDIKQPVFNLEVASDRDYFVGRTGFLVHDNSLIEPVDHPFDEAPTLSVQAK